MPDKDNFTFDDSDDFPETDLNDAFADGEYVNPDPDPEEEGDDQGETSKKPWSGGGDSRTRILLILLLLVVGVGAGAYYFMDLGGTTPTVPTVPIAPERVAAVVTPQTTPVPAQPSTEQAVSAESQPVTVAVPVPLPPQSAEPAGQSAEGAPAGAAPDVAVATPAPANAPPVEAAPAAVVADKPAEMAVVPAEAPATAVSSPVKEEAAMKVAAQGAYTLDAGSYLLADSRDKLVKKLRGLGYEPLVTPIKATIDMTRLSLGAFPASEAESTLAFARTIEPTSFSVPAGDGFVIYAGTFLQAQNVDALIARFQKEGLRAKAEPVQVPKTLSRIRFGSFASREEAAEAAKEAASSGVKSTVVKGR